MTNEKLRVFLTQLFQNIPALVKEVNFFIRRKLCDKKIVIISESGIVNIPISFGLQASLSVLAIFLMLWVSYSTDKYFSYDNIISKKNREIWTTNIANENLQYQVSDLHDNLMELNKYFDNIRRYDQLAGKSINSDKDRKKMEVSSNDKNIHKDANVKSILSNIRAKVLERIGSLESIIEMTGLTVESVAARNDALRQVIINKGESASNENMHHQGGAYSPIDSDINSQSFDKEVKYLMQLEKVIHSFPLAAPMKRYWVSSYFGKRVDPIKKRIAMHAGTDLVSRFKSKVYSSAPGTVKSAGRYGAYGRFIEIEHGSGVTTRYGHLNKILVRKGQSVDRGQIIGLQGNSGRSTGTHLHYEVRYNKKAYDPRNFLKAGRYVF